MRSRSNLVLIAVAGLLVAGGSAHAGVLTAATWTASIQGIALTITNSGATCTDTNPNRVQYNQIACSAGGLTPTGTATATNYNVSLTVPLFDFSAYTTGGVVAIKTEATLSGGQVIAGIETGATATKAVAGMVTTMAALHADMGVNASKFTAAMTTLVKVPLSVGKAGTFTGSFFVLQTHYFTVDFYAWTPHTQVFTGLTSKFAPLPDVTAKGSFMLTAGGGGTVTLVSPSKISIDGPFSQRRTASFTTLKLTYAPEPGLLLLLGAGVGLALVERRRHR